MKIQLRNFGKLFIALLFLAGVAAAQQQPYGGSINAKDHGYQHGYRDGLRQGRMDISRNAAHSFDNEEYRRADIGYEGYMGERDDFQKGYREGYKSGYEDGFYNKAMHTEIYGVDERYDPDALPRTGADADSYANWNYSDVAFDTGSAQSAAA